MPNFVKLSIVIIAICAACTPTPKLISHSEMIKICEQEKREAAGVTGKVMIGANSKRGMIGGLQLRINDKFIRGMDPEVVYNTCIDRISKENELAKQQLANNQNN